MCRYRKTRLTSLATVAVMVIVCGSPAPARAAAAKGTDSQLDFGIKMAKRGLWSEALFRFSRVLEERPGDSHVLNNMAVAYEAIGQFDKALEHYKLALERDPSNRELRRNYAQFIEFYQGLKPESPDSPESKNEAATAATDTEQPVGDGKVP